MSGGLFAASASNLETGKSSSKRRVCSIRGEMAEFGVTNRKILTDQILGFTRPIENKLFTGLREQKMARRGIEPVSECRSAKNIGRSVSCSILFAEGD